VAPAAEKVISEGASEKTADPIVKTGDAVTKEVVKEAAENAGFNAMIQEMQRLAGIRS